MVASYTGALRVPAACPIYAPGGRDVDTVEDPIPRSLTAFCAVDSAAESYGVIGGDAETAQLAVLPGKREIGLYFAFDQDAAPSVAALEGLKGPDAAIKAYAAPVRVDGGGIECCAEDYPESRRPATVAAYGQDGLMISLGSFDDAPLQVAVELDLDRLFRAGPPAIKGWSSGYLSRFYVNAEPQSSMPNRPRGVTISSRSTSQAARP